MADYYYTILLQQLLFKKPLEILFLFVICRIGELALLFFYYVKCISHGDNTNHNSPRYVNIMSTNDVNEYSATIGRDKASFHCYVWLIGRGQGLENNKRYLEYTKRLKIEE